MLSRATARAATLQAAARSSASRTGARLPPTATASGGATINHVPAVVPVPTPAAGAAASACPLGASARRAYHRRPDPFHKLLTDALRTDTAAAEAAASGSKGEQLFIRLGSRSLGMLGPTVSLREATGKQPLTAVVKSSPVPPIVRFVKDEEVDAILHKTEHYLLGRGEELVDITRPTVVPEARQLEVNPELGNRRFDFVFVDTSNKEDDMNREIRIRETSGVLRTATPDERDRYNQIFFPKQYKKATLPPLFSDPYLSLALSENHHADILDGVSRFRQPHQDDYKEIHRRVFDDVEARSIFSILQDTPHWAKLMQYLWVTKRINNLLVALLEKGRVEDAATLVTLFHTENSSAPSAVHVRANNLKAPLDIVEAYSDSAQAEVLAAVVNRLKKRRA